MSSVIVEYEKVIPEIVTITMNHPARMNAMGSELTGQLSEAFQRFGEDKQARVAVLRSALSNFSGGVDIKEWAVSGPHLSQPITEVPERDWGLPVLHKPIIAAVEGYCVGISLDMFLFYCDIRIAGEDAQFLMPEVARGVIPLATPFGRQGVPYAVWADLILTCEPCPADRALQAGLLSRVVPTGTAFETALTLARRIAKFSPIAIQYAKANATEVMRPAAEAYRHEQYLRQRSLYSPEFQEGMDSWLEKRDPAYEDADHSKVS